MDVPEVERKMYLPDEFDVQPGDQFRIQILMKMSINFGC